MNYIDFFANTFLFRGFTNNEIAEFINGAFEVHDYKRGEMIYSCDSFEKKIGFVYSGECEVKAESNSTTLNTILPYSSFGIIAIFSKKEKFPTNVYAKKATRVLFITDAKLLVMLEQSLKITMNVISFLIERIDFLNNRVSTYTEDTVEDRLLSYIRNISEKNESREIVLNYKRTAEALSVARPSVYRAISSLIEKGAIKKDEKKIILI